MRTREHVIIRSSCDADSVKSSSFYPGATWLHQHQWFSVKHSCSPDPGDLNHHGEELLISFDGLINTIIKSKFYERIVGLVFNPTENK